MLACGRQEKKEGSGHKPHRPHDRETFSLFSRKGDALLPAHCKGDAPASCCFPALASVASRRAAIASVSSRRMRVRSTCSVDDRRMGVSSGLPPPTPLSCHVA